jgi:hypothetical protein
MDTISDKITDTIETMSNISSTLKKIKDDVDVDTNINSIKEYIVLLQANEQDLNNVVPLSKYDGTAKILKNNFKHLYNKQYTKNATLIVGILLVSGIVIKMSFYETIDYPRVL